MVLRMFLGHLRHLKDAMAEEIDSYYAFVLFAQGKLLSYLTAIKDLTDQQSAGSLKGLLKPMRQLNPAQDDCSKSLQQAFQFGRIG